MFTVQEKSSPAHFGPFLHRGSGLHKHCAAALRIRKICAKSKYSINSVSRRFRKCAAMRRIAGFAQIRKYEIRTCRSKLGLGFELGLDLGLVRLGATNQNYEQIIALIS